MNITTSDGCLLEAKAILAEGNGADQQSASALHAAHIYKHFEFTAISSKQLSNRAFNL